MVVIHFKRNDKEEFLHDVSAETSIEDLIFQLCLLHNSRTKLYCIAKGIEDLIENGPLRPEAMRGLTTPETITAALGLLSSEEKAFELAQPQGSQITKPDKTGWRCGRVPIPDIASKLQQVCKLIKETLQPSTENLKKNFTLQESAKLESLAKGAVMIAYPGYYDLPLWDPVYILLERPSEAIKIFGDADWLDPSESSLWWAKKELTRGKLLSVFVGKNEKTRIIVKISKRGQGPPLSEPPIDKSTHIKMLSYYHRKQEEHKKLEEATEDDYLNSQWADPRGLKNTFVTGGRNISFKR